MYCTFLTNYHLSGVKLFNYFSRYSKNKREKFIGKVRTLKLASIL